MSEKSFVPLFEQLQQTMETLQKQQLEDSHLDTLVDALEQLVYAAQPPHSQDAAPTNDLSALYTPAQIRQAVHLSVLQAVKNDRLPALYYPTPDTVAQLVAFFVMTLCRQSEMLLFDPAVGSGQLLSVVTQQLMEQKRRVHTIGCDTDKRLLALAAMVAQYHSHTAQWIHQDGVQPLLFDHPDVVVSEVPVGYYPDDVLAAAFHSHAPTGHSYAHHLLMEHSITHLKPGGWAFFVVPQNLFDSAQAPLLWQWLQEAALLQAFLTLPDQLVQSETDRKAIVCVQKKGGTARQAQTLLATLPPLRDAKKMHHFIKQFHNWAQSVL